MNKALAVRSLGGKEGELRDQRSSRAHLTLVDSAHAVFERAAQVAPKNTSPSAVEVAPKSLEVPAPANDVISVAPKPSKVPGLLSRVYAYASDLAETFTTIFKVLKVFSPVSLALFAIGCGDSSNTPVVSDLSVTRDISVRVDGNSSEGGACDVCAAPDLSQAPASADGPDTPDLATSFDLATPSDLAPTMVMSFDGGVYVMPNHPVTCQQEMPKIDPNALIVLVKGQPSQEFTLTEGATQLIQFPLGNDNKTLVLQVGFLATNNNQPVVDLLENGDGMCMELQGSQVVIAPNASGQIPADQFTLTVSITGFNDIGDKNGHVVTAKMIVQAN